MSYPRATTKQWLRSGSSAGQRRFPGSWEAYPRRRKAFRAYDPSGVACRLEGLEKISSMA